MESILPIIERSTAVSHGGDGSGDVKCGHSGEAFPVNWPRLARAVLSQGSYPHGTQGPELGTPHSIGVP